MFRLNADSVVGGIILLFGLAVFALSFNVGSVAWGGESARLFPQIVSIIIAFLGAQLLFKGLKVEISTIDFGSEAGGVLQLMLLGLIYIFAIDKFGYLISTGVAAPVAFLIFGVRSPIGLAFSAVLCPIVYFLIFFVLLGLFPPLGKWFDLLDVLPEF